MPGSEGTAAVVVLAKSSGEFTDEDIVWLQGEFDPMIQMPAGGANELFTEFSNVEVMGELFVPPATISEDNTTAVLTIPMDEIDDVDEQAERIVEVRAIIAENVPAGIEPYVTG
ncbi:MAG: MMPL family transporter, partial [Pontimonas sp.]|nr:MMPL family transporter [Pontimonas sp.]